MSKKKDIELRFKKLESNFHLLRQRKKLKHYANSAKYLEKIMEKEDDSELIEMEKEMVILQPELDKKKKEDEIKKEMPPVEDMVYALWEKVMNKKSEKALKIEKKKKEIEKKHK